MSFEAVFFDNHTRYGRHTAAHCSIGEDVVISAYRSLQKEVFEESIEGYTGDKRDVVSVIQFILDSNVYSSSVVKDLIKNHTSYSLEELVDKIIPLNLLQMSWKVKSIVFLKK